MKSKKHKITQNSLNISKNKVQVSKKFVSLAAIAFLGLNSFAAPSLQSMLEQKVKAQQLQSQSSNTNNGQKRMEMTQKELLAYLQSHPNAKVIKDPNNPLVPSGATMDPNTGMITETMQSRNNPGLNWNRQGQTTFKNVEIPSTIKTQEDALKYLRANGYPDLKLTDLTNFKPGNDSHAKVAVQPGVIKQGYTKQSTQEVVQQNRPTGSGWVDKGEVGNIKLSTNKVTIDIPSDAQINGHGLTTKQDVYDWLKTNKPEYSSLTIDQIDVTDLPVKHEDKQIGTKAINQNTPQNWRVETREVIYSDVQPAGSDWTQTGSRWVFGGQNQNVTIPSDATVKVNGVDTLVTTPDLAKQWLLQQYPQLVGHEDKIISVQPITPQQNVQQVNVPTGSGWTKTNPSPIHVQLPTMQSVTLPANAKLQNGNKVTDHSSVLTWLHENGYPNIVDADIDWTTLLLPTYDVLHGEDKHWTGDLSNIPSGYHEVAGTRQTVVQLNVPNGQGWIHSGTQQQTLTDYNKVKENEQKITSYNQNMNDLNTHFNLGLQTLTNTMTQSQIDQIISDNNNNNKIDQFNKNIIKQTQQVTAQNNQQINQYNTLISGLVTIPGLGNLQRITNTQSQTDINNAVSNNNNLLQNYIKNTQIQTIPNIVKYNMDVNNLTSIGVLNLQHIPTNSTPDQIKAIVDQNNKIIAAYNAQKVITDNPNTQGYVTTKTIHTIQTSGKVFDLNDFSLHPYLDKNTGIFTYFLIEPVQASDVDANGNVSLTKQINGQTYTLKQNSNGVMFYELQKRAQVQVKQGQNVNTGSQVDLNHKVKDSSNTGNRDYEVGSAFFSISMDDHNNPKWSQAPWQSAVFSLVDPDTGQPVAFEWNMDLHGIDGGYDYSQQNGQGGTGGWGGQGLSGYNTRWVAEGLGFSGFKDASGRPISPVLTASFNADPDILRASDSGKYSSSKQLRFQQAQKTANQLTGHWGYGRAGQGLENQISQDPNNPKWTDWNDHKVFNQDGSTQRDLDHNNRDLTGNPQPVDGWFTSTLGDGVPWADAQGLIHIPEVSEFTGWYSSNRNGAWMQIVPSESIKPTNIVAKDIFVKQHQQVNVLNLETTTQDFSTYNKVIQSLNNPSLKPITSTMTTQQIQQILTDNAASVNKLQSQFFIQPGAQVPPYFKIDPSGLITINSPTVPNMLNTNQWLNQAPTGTFTNTQTVSAVGILPPLSGETQAQYQIRLDQYNQQHGTHYVINSFTVQNKIEDKYSTIDLSKDPAHASEHWQNVGTFTTNFETIATDSYDFENQVKHNVDYRVINGNFVATQVIDNVYKTQKIDTDALLQELQTQFGSNAINKLQDINLVKSILTKLAPNGYVLVDKMLNGKHVFYYESQTSQTITEHVEVEIPSWIHTPRQQQQQFWNGYNWQSRWINLQRQDLLSTSVKSDDDANIDYHDFWENAGRYGFGVNPADIQYLPDGVFHSHTNDISLLLHMSGLDTTSDQGMKVRDWYTDENNNEIHVNKKYTFADLDFDNNQRKEQWIIHSDITNPQFHSISQNDNGNIFKQGSDYVLEGTQQIFDHDGATFQTSIMSSHDNFFEYKGTNNAWRTFLTFNDVPTPLNDVTDIIYHLQRQVVSQPTIMLNEQLQNQQWQTQRILLEESSRLLLSDTNVQSTTNKWERFEIEKDLVTGQSGHISMHNTQEENTYHRDAQPGSAILSGSHQEQQYSRDKIVKDEVVAVTGHVNAPQAYHDHKWQRDILVKDEVKGHIDVKDLATWFKQSFIIETDVPVVYIDEQTHQQLPKYDPLSPTHSQTTLDSSYPKLYDKVKGNEDYYVNGPAIYNQKTNRWEIPVRNSIIKVEVQDQGGNLLNINTSKFEANIRLINDKVEWLPNSELAHYFDVSYDPITKSVVFTKKLNDTTKQTEIDMFNNVYRLTDINSFADVNRNQGQILHHGDVIAIR